MIKGYISKYCKLQFKCACYFKYLIESTLTTLSLAKLDFLNFFDSYVEKFQNEFKFSQFIFLDFESFIYFSIIYQNFLIMKVVRQWIENVYPFLIWIEFTQISDWSVSYQRLKIHFLTAQFSLNSEFLRANGNSAWFLFRNTWVLDFACSISSTIINIL